MDYDPKEAKKLILEYEDGTKIDVTKLDQNQYESFLDMMLGMVKSYTMIKEIKKRKEDGIPKTKREEGEKMYPIKNQSES